MPEYLYQHPESLEVKSVFQKMMDEHIFIDDMGVKWQRLFTKPQAAVSTISKIDPNNPEQFVNVTGQKRGKYGDLLDLSKELSEKREKQQGVDPVLEKANENYRKTHRNHDLPQIKKKKLKEQMKSNSMFELDI